MRLKPARCRFHPMIVIPPREPIVVALPMPNGLAATAPWRNVIVVHALSGEGSRGIAEQEGGRGRLDTNASYVAGQVSDQQSMNSMDIVTNRARNNSAQSAVSIEKSLCPAQEFGAVVALGDGVLLWSLLSLFFARAYRFVYPASVPEVPRCRVRLDIRLSSQVDFMWCI
jgi:hypothetical protein